MSDIILLSKTSKLYQLIHAAGAEVVGETLKPKRIQRKRTKGWRMPEGAVYVGRGTKWGNPFVVGEDGGAQECVDLFYWDINHPNSRLCFEYADLAQLKGKDLACWCALDKPCHADVLLELANPGWKKS